MVLICRMAHTVPFPPLNYPRPCHAPERRRLYGELEGWLSTLPDPDPVLRRRGDDASILAELSADDQVATAIAFPKNRVLNCPHFTLRRSAGGARSRPLAAQNLFERFQQDLERANLRLNHKLDADAPFYGYTPLSLS